MWWRSLSPSWRAAGGALEARWYLCVRDPGRIELSIRVGISMLYITACMILACI